MLHTLNMRPPACLARELDDTEVEGTLPEAYSTMAKLQTV